MRLDAYFFEISAVLHAISIHVHMVGCSIGFLFIFDKHGFCLKRILLQIVVFLHCPCHFYHSGSVFLFDLSINTTKVSTSGCFGCHDLPENLPLFNIETSRFFVCYNGEMKTISGKNHNQNHGKLTSKTKSLSSIAVEKCDQSEDKSAA